MKLLVMSDLHCDIGKLPVEVEGQRIDEDVDVIILAGDTHEGVQAPMWARDAFPDKRIIMICGNHEFYGRFWRRNLKLIREKAEDLGIDFLENDALEIDGVRFLGCTMWTDFELFGPDLRHEAMSAARDRLNDYQRIKLDRKPGENQDFREFRNVKLVPELTRRRHRESVAWLEEQLAQGDPARTVVVTHHAPTFESIPLGYRSDYMSGAYASDLTRLMGRSALWFHGHVHESQDYTVNGTRVVANPRGYPGRNGKPENERFNPFLRIEI